jgi:hypothetical protein
MLPLGGEHIRLREPPVRRVLVPGHEAGAPRLLGEEGSVPAQEIGSEHVLHRVEDGGVPDEVGEPREQQMGLDPIDTAQGGPEIALDSLEALTVLLRLSCGEDGHGEEVSLALVLRERRRRQALAHAARRLPP